MEKDLKEEVANLKEKMLELKKTLRNTTSENQLMKVKIRKLQNEIDKKNKQVDALLDPKKTKCVRKIISERGANLIINLRHRNQELEQEVLVKDEHIKKLQADIETTKLYLPNNILHNKSSACSRSRNSSTVSSPRASHVQLSHTQLEENLKKIKQARMTSMSSTLQKNSSHQPEVPKKEKSANNLLIKTKSKEEEEKKNVNTNDFLKTIIQEMKSMKDTISKLSTDQETTKKILKNKNRNIEYLSKQIRVLKKSMSPVKLNSSTSTASISPLTNNKRREEIPANTSYSQESFETDSSASVRKVRNSMKSGITSMEKNKNNINSDDDDDVQTENSK